jgi:hypothetical protein
MSTKTNFYNSCVIATSLAVTTSQLYQNTNIDTLATTPITCVFHIGTASAFYAMTTTFILDLFPEMVKLPMCGLIAGLAGYNIYSCYWKKSIKLNKYINNFKLDKSINTDNVSINDSASITDTSDSETLNEKFEDATSENSVEVNNSTKSENSADVDNSFEVINK